MAAVQVLPDQQLVNSVKESYVNDDEWQRVIEQQNNHYTFINGVVYYKGAVCVGGDAALRARLIRECHDSATAGHLAERKTKAAVARRYYWQGINSDVSNYVIACASCQKNKKSNLAPAGLMQSLPVPERRWDVVTMDFMTQLPTTAAGNDAIVVFVDKLSKLVHIVPCKSNITAPQTAHLYLNHVVRHHGLARVIISDRDPKFTSKFWRALHQQLDTKIALSTAYHPQTDGQTENANRNIQTVLRHVVNKRHNDWDEHLLMVEIAINSSVQESTGFSPFYLNSGQHPTMITDLQFEQQQPNLAVNELLQRLQADVLAAQQSIREAQQRQTTAANKHRRDVTYVVGDKVLLSTVNFSQEAGLSKKFKQPWIGPFVVEQVRPPVNCVLTLPATMRIFNVFHVSLLKPYVESEHQQPLPMPAAVHISADQEYVVERIIKRSRMIIEGVMRDVYLVKWLNFDSSENTWEPLSNLRGDDGTVCQQLKDFQAAARR